MRVVPIDRSPAAGSLHRREVSRLGPKQLPEVARQVEKLVKGFKDTAEDLRKTVEPELNIIQQEVKMVEQDFQASIKDAEEQVNASTTAVVKQPESTRSSNQV